MRSADSDDLTAKARIRDAAIECFARDGFDAPIRTIAAAAGVSPALVIHHFGSKAGLQAACDTRMWELIAESKAAILAGPDPSSGLLAELARIDAYGPMAAYIVRALRTRGDTARQFIESYYEPTADLLDAMVAAGTVRPPRDPEAMMKYLVMESMGLFLVYSILHPEQTEGAQITRGLMAEVGVAMFDVMTHGLFTDSSLLDTYAASVPPAPTTSSDEEPES